MRIKLLLTVMTKILLSENAVSTAEGESVPESQSVSVDSDIKS